MEDNKANVFFSYLAGTPHSRPNARIMVKKLPACYGIRKGRGAPVVVHSWSEVVAKVRGRDQITVCRRGQGVLPHREPACFVFRGADGGAAAIASDSKSARRREMGVRDPWPVSRYACVHDYRSVVLVEDWPNDAR